MKNNTLILCMFLLSGCLNNDFMERYPLGNPTIKPEKPVKPVGLEVSLLFLIKKKILHGNITVSSAALI